MKLALFFIALATSPIFADHYSCVVDLYLAAHDLETLRTDVGASAFDFVSRQLLGTQESNKGRFDRINLVVTGIPQNFQPQLVPSGTAFYYFPGHYSVSQYLDAQESIKKMVLTFQKIVAGPGSYVKADSMKTASWNRTTYCDLTGVFLHSGDLQFDPDFIGRYGEPLYVELEAGVKTIALENGVHLIPGAATSLVVPVKARVLTPEEREHLIRKPDAAQTIIVRPATSVRPGLR